MRKSYFTWEEVGFANINIKKCETCNGGKWTFRECLNCGDIYQYTGKYSSCSNEVRCEGLPSKKAPCPDCKN